MRIARSAFLMIGALFSALTFLASIPLAEAQTILAGNLQKLGIDVPAYLQTATANWIALVIGVVGLVLTIVLARRRLRRPDFDDINTWSVSADFGNATVVTQDAQRIILFKQSCRFANASTTQAREIDVHLIFKTIDPNVPLLEISTTNTHWQHHKREMVKKGIPLPDDRFMRWLSLPIRLEPNGYQEGQIEFDVHSNKKMLEVGFSDYVDPFTYRVVLVERRSGQRKKLKTGECYDANKQLAYKGRVGSPSPVWRQRWARTRQKARLFMGKTEERFDRLLKRMTEGEAPSAQKRKVAGRASDAEPNACSSDTQTRPDTSEDASR